MEEIGRGAHSVVYRARRTQGLNGDLPVAVKLQRERADAAAGPWIGPLDPRARLRREAAILGRVTHPALPSVWEVGEADGRLYLVMELVEGPTLASLLAEGPLPQADVVTLGRTLAAALAALHRAGLVHRDVKPQNVVLPAAAPGAAKLVDFGFAAHADAPTGRTGGTGHSGDDEVIGTLLYCAPEQAGMLRRPVDGRSDLYALGAVLFECATGQPPFPVQDAGELLRAHATLPPPDARDLNPAVTPALAAMLARLLAKDPDDRYQTGGGLLRDLNRIEQLDALLRAGDDAVILGGSDRAPRQSEETPLIGRDVELAGLRAGWSEALAGRGSASLILGAPGSGKSRLVWEHLQGVRRDGGTVLHGKCVEENPFPLAVLREAVDGWLRQVRQRPRPERAAAEQTLRRAAGDRAPLLRGLSPLLTQALGLSAAVLDPAGTVVDADRFHEAAADFLVKLLAAEGPGAVLFLDDVQWLDEGSRAVLARLAPLARRERIQLLCAAREDAAATAGWETLRAALGVPAELRLPPLESRDVARLIAAYLGGHVPDDALTARITALSSGSPFAVGEYVRALLDEGILRPHWGSWVVDADGLERLRLPSGVAQLLALRVAALPPRAREVLGAAAVLGPRFSPATLAAVCDLPLDAVHADVAEAERARLIERRGAGDYAVVHDQVRQVLEARLDAAQRRALHQRAAAALETLGAADPELVYRLANHYALGEIERDPARVFETCRAAGLAALRGFADDEALRFLSAAHRAATEHALPLTAAVRLELEETLGQLCARVAQWDDAVSHLEAALALSSDDPSRTGDGSAEAVRRARLRCQLAEVYYSNRELGRAWEEIRAGFAALGERLPLPLGDGAPPLPTGARRARVDTQGLKAALGTLRAWTLAVNPIRPLSRRRRRAPSDEERARLRTLVALYAVGAHVAYLDNRSAAMAQLILRALLPARRLGPSPELVTTYTAYGMLLGTLGQPRLAARATARAVEIARRIGDRAVLGRALAGQAWGRHVAGFPREAETLMRRALEEHGQWMAAQDFITGCTDLAWNLAMRGHCRQAWHWIWRALGRSRDSAGGPRGGSSLAANAAALLTALGEHDEAAPYAERARRLAEEVPNASWRWGDYLARLAHMHVERDELGAPLEETGARHRAFGFRPESATFHARHFYVYWAYGQLARCHRAAAQGAPADRAVALAQLGAAADALRRAGTHPTLRCHALVVQGAWLRLSGKRAAAALLLDRAERLATATDNQWALYEVARQRAHAALEAGATERAAQLAQRALAYATEHGWANRERWIRREFPTVLPWQLARRGAAGALAHDSVTLTAAQRRAERHLDALLKVSAATGAALDPSHVARVALDQVISILGAERAFLFLCSDYSEELAFAAGRDATRGDLDSPPDGGGAGGGPSRTVLDQVRATREPVLNASAREGALNPSESIVAHDLRSIVAVPLLMPGRLVGALYLDSRIASGVFHDEDVAVLRAIAGHIAVAVTVAQAFARQAALAEENGLLLDQLSEQVEELQRSRQRITEAEERQKREIAELLHGRVQTKLLLASHRLGELERHIATNPMHAAELLQALRAELDQIREHDVRQASHLLHPTIIRLGLVPALHLLAERFEPQFRVRVSASPEIAQLDDPIENKLPEALRLGAYRMVEEALGNAAKHAHPTTVEVLLLREQDQLVLRIKDDGRGFDPDALRPGLGLGSIDGRVDQLRGSWDLAGAPGAGATLTVRLPLDAA